MVLLCSFSHSSSNNKSHYALLILKDINPVKTQYKHWNVILLEGRFKRIIFGFQWNLKINVPWSFEQNVIRFLKYKSSNILHHILKSSRSQTVLLRLQIQARLWPNKSNDFIYSHIMWCQSLKQCKPVIKIYIFLYFCSYKYK